MSSFSLALVGLRILAIYCFVQSIPLFAAFGVVGALSRAEDPLGRSQTSAVVTALFPGGSLLIVAILLYLFSVRLAKHLAGGHQNENTQPTCSFEQLQIIAFAFAGILILVLEIPGLLRGIEAAVELRRYKKEGGSVTPHQSYDTWLYFIGVVAQVVVGLVLLLNPRAFRNAWHWLRTAGTGRPADPSH
jgi:hypothetical protein